MRCTQITINQITAQTIVFNVIEPTTGMFGDDTRTKLVEMPLADAAKIIDAINKYADISIASKALAEFID